MARNHIHDAHAAGDGFRGGDSPVVELVIFDCDGVLVDSEAIAVEIDRIILAEHGWHLTTEEVVDRFLGRSFSHVQLSLEGHLGHALPATWEAEQAPRYLEAFTEELRPVSGIEAAHDAISLATCIASSGSHEKLRHTLGLTGLAPRFQGRVFSASEVTRGKPAPDLFLHAAAKMGVAPERAVVVEDSQHGVAAGLAPGMRVLRYAGGMTPQKWLEEAGAIVFRDMAHLPRWIKELNRSHTA